MELNLTVAIDDVHPEKGWGMPGDECMNYLHSLNQEYGTKFTLFIPSNYHNKYPISEYKEWIDWLLSLGYFELAAHGHYHMTRNRDLLGEMEFVDMTEPECVSRIDLMLNEWNKVGHKPAGWRNPGWMCQPYCVNHLSKNFDYAAVHYEHNHNLNWGCKTLFGHDGIHETNIKLHNDNTLMFQSHIAGDWNKNVWNKENYEQFKLSLDYLKEIHILSNKFLNEL